MRVRISGSLYNTPIVADGSRGRTVYESDFEEVGEREDLNGLLEDLLEDFCGQAHREGRRSS